MGAVIVSRARVRPARDPVFHRSSGRAPGRGCGPRATGRVGRTASPGRVTPSPGRFASGAGRSTSTGGPGAPAGGQSPSSRRPPATRPCRSTSSTGRAASHADRAPQRLVCSATPPCRSAQLAGSGMAPAGETNQPSGRPALRAGRFSASGGGPTIRTAPPALLPRCGAVPPGRSARRLCRRAPSGGTAAPAPGHRAAAGWSSARRPYPRTAPRGSSALRCCRAPARGGDAATPPWRGAAPAGARAPGACRAALCDSWLPTRARPSVLRSGRESVRGATRAVFVRCPPAGREGRGGGEPVAALAIDDPLT